MTIVKVQKARRSYGRGPDNCYTPARYHATMRNGSVYLIISEEIRYMGKASWKGRRLSGDHPRLMFGPYNTKAKLLADMTRSEATESNHAL